MGEKKESIEELRKEFEGQKVIVYPGPKKSLRVVVMVLLSLCFIFGLGMLSTKKLTTGYTVFAYDPSNWYGIILLFIPLVLSLYWLKKR